MNTQSTPSSQSASSCASKCSHGFNQSRCTGLLLLVFGAAAGGVLYAFPDALGIRPENAVLTALSMAVSCGVVGAFMCAKGVVQINRQGGGQTCCSAKGA